LKRFPHWDQFEDPELRREIKYLIQQGPGTMPKEDVAKVMKF